MALALLGVLGAVNTAVTPFGHNKDEFLRLMGYFSTTKKPARLLDGEASGDSIAPEELGNLVNTLVANDYQLVSCDNVGKCPDGVIRTTCKWQRFLSYAYTPASVYTDPVDVYIATNGLPDHCYKSD